MILTSTERKFKRLNNKKAKLELKFKNYNDSNDPLETKRKIINSRIKKLNAEIEKVERVMNSTTTLSYKKYNNKTGSWIR